jgi:hypothetical protein
MLQPSVNDLVFQVCENDILLVDVVNRVPGQGFGIHWRGQPQKETPVMDGVPMVTQCPIPSSTTFQYKFRASKAGTHMWHAHTGTVPICPFTETLYLLSVKQHVYIKYKLGLHLSVYNKCHQQALHADVNQEMYIPVCVCVCLYIYITN